MASEHKKAKLKNSHLWKGGLKDKTKLKRVGFFNSAFRQKMKKEGKDELKQE